MSAGRFIIEGEWTGYRSSQQKVVHRQVYPGGRKKLRAWAEKTHGILYTDGTKLLLTVRDCKPRERVQEIRGYTSLIEDCAHYDVDSVEAFYSARDAFRSAAAARRAAETTGSAA